jgi:hypothetical protein
MSYEIVPKFIMMEIIKTGEEVEWKQGTCMMYNLICVVIKRILINTTSIFVLFVAYCESLGRACALVG